MPEQNPEGMSDDVRQADESGEPQRAGRQQGRVIDKNDPDASSRPAGDDGARPADPNNSTERSEHWESGRQRAN